MQHYYIIIIDHYYIIIIFSIIDAIYKIYKKNPRIPSTYLLLNFVRPER